MSYLHQTPEDIINASSPETRILWNELFLKFGEKIALRQYYYSGVLASSELAIFTPRKLYLALNVTASQFAAGQFAVPQLQIYDENNAMILGYAGHNTYWDATAAAVKWNALTINVSNVYFSRLAVGISNYIKFIGYRITY